jgi:hypothetical protein
LKKTGFGQRIISKMPWKKGGAFPGMPEKPQ